MSIRYDGKASGGVDFTTTLKSLGRGERSFENQFGFKKSRSTLDAIPAVVDIATKARRGTSKRKGFREVKDLHRSDGAEEGSILPVAND